LARKTKTAPEKGSSLTDLGQFDFEICSVSGS
jgi:hypothetical protein